MSKPVSDRPGIYGATESEAAQRRAFTGGDIPVAVYGLGKIGLPLAGVYADVTGNAVGVDIDPAVVEAVNRGESPITREPGLPDLVADVVDRGALRATANPTDGARDAAVHVLVVPTLLDEDDVPDLSILEDAVRDVGAGLSPGDLVIVESTVPPRTTADRVVPLLAETSGLDPGEFGAAACPERTVSGQAIADIRGTHPKVVGGVDSESTRAARMVYDEITDNDVLTTTDATTAEAVKVFEGVYRDVNIALANQLALFAREMDIDVNEAIDVANTQPFCDIHSPGPGVGGHCIPVYPYFLSEQFDADGSLLEVARDVNDGMPEHTVSLIEAVLSAHGPSLADARVLLLGLTYKANINELRNAPALPLLEALRDRGARVTAVDPVLDDWSAIRAERTDLETARTLDADAVVLVTPHDEFLALDWAAFDAPILDGRGVIDNDGIDVPVYTVGGRWP
jgi:UDP-N-acetyl-D-mannosaminuronic acid dehydrogenase